MGAAIGAARPASVASATAGAVGTADWVGARSVPMRVVGTTGEAGGLVSTALVPPLFEPPAWVADHRPPATTATTAAATPAISRPRRRGLGPIPSEDRVAGSRVSLCAAPVVASGSITTGPLALGAIDGRP